MKVYIFITILLLIANAFYAAESDEDIQALSLPEDVAACLKTIKPMAIAFGDCLAENGEKPTHAQNKECFKIVDNEEVRSCEELSRGALSPEKRDEVSEMVVNSWAKLDQWNSK